MSNILFNYIWKIQQCKSVSLLLFLIKRPEINFSDTHGMVMKTVLESWQIIFTQGNRVEWELVNNHIVMSENDPISIRWELTDCFIVIPIENVKCWLQRSTSLIQMLNSRWIMLCGLTHFTTAAMGKIF